MIARSIIWDAQLACVAVVVALFLTDVLFAWSDALVRTFRVRMGGAEAVCLLAIVLIVVLALMDAVMGLGWFALGIPNFRNAASEREYVQGELVILGMYVVSGVVCGPICAIVARRSGESPWRWYVYGTILSVLAVWRIAIEAKRKRAAGVLEA